MRRGRRYAKGHQCQPDLGRIEMPLANGLQNILGSGSQGLAQNGTAESVTEMGGEVPGKVPERQQGFGVRPLTPTPTRSVDRLAGWPGTLAVCRRDLVSDRNTTIDSG